MPKCCPLVRLINNCCPSVAQSSRPAENRQFRQAHNLKVVGSNPTPVTIKTLPKPLSDWMVVFCCLDTASSSIAARPPTSCTLGSPRFSPGQSHFELFQDKNFTYAPYFKSLSMGADGQVQKFSYPRLGNIANRQNFNTL